jgi:hypothetical protein
VTLGKAGADPYEYLLDEASPEKVRLTMVDGVSLFEREET